MSLSCNVERIVSLLVVNNFIFSKVGYTKIDLNLSGMALTWIITLIAINALGEWDKNANTRGFLSMTFLTIIDWSEIHSIKQIQKIVSSPFLKCAFLSWWWVRWLQAAGNIRIFIYHTSQSLYIFLMLLEVTYKTSSNLSIPHILLADSPYLNIRA